MSLKSPHPIFLTAGPFPYKVSMATVQAVMLSGRYPCDSLLRHWSTKISGKCVISSSCNDNGIADDLQHILQDCPALQATRVKLSDFTKSYIVDNGLPRDLDRIICFSFEPTYAHFTSFLIDCSSFPYVISAVQSLGTDVLFHLFTLSRIWNYSLHKERLKLRGEWKRKFTWPVLKWRRLSTQIVEFILYVKNPWNSLLHLILFRLKNQLVVASVQSKLIK